MNGPNRKERRDHVSPRIGPNSRQSAFSSVHEELKKSPNRRRDPDARPCRSPRSSPYGRHRAANLIPTSA
jgi:hypothetical protein